MKLSRIYTVLFLGLPTLAIANEEAKELDGISVVALRDASSYAKEANKTVILDKSQLQTEQASSVAQALENVPNITVEGGERTINQKVDIRGLTGNRVVQVIDGVKQYFELKNRGSYFLPLSMVQDLEVIKGPASTLWGSGALGGVVAMRTPSALDLLESGQKFGTKINQGYQSANNLSETSAMVYAANEQFDALLGGFYNHASDLRLGGGQTLENSKYIQKGGLAKLGWQINEANRLALSYRLVRIKQTAPSDNNLQDGRLAADTPVGNNGLNYKQFMKLITDARNGSIHMVDYKYSPLIKQSITDQSTILDYSFNPNSKLIDANITLYHNATLEREDWLHTNVKDYTKYITDGVNLRNSSDFDWLYLTYGIDYARNKISTVREKNTSFESTYRPSDYNGSSDNLGAYLQGHIPLFDKTLILSPALRYDYYKTDAHGDFKTAEISLPAGSKVPTIKHSQILNNPNFNDHHFSPSFAITWKPIEFFSLGLKYNEAFRSPSLQESFANGYLFGIKLVKPLQVMYPSGAYGAHLYPNLSLRPEIARNKEIDVNFHFDNILTQGDNIQFTTAYFINDIKDMIDAHLLFAPQGAAAQYVNIPKARIQGFEIGTKYQTENLGVGISYGQTFGKITRTDPNNPFLRGLKEGDPLDNIPAGKLTVTTDYYVIPEALNVGMVVSYYRHQDRVSNSYQRNWGDGTLFKSYILTEIHTTYAPKTGMFKDFRVDFAIDNLFDQKYRPAFGLIDGVGRNFKLNVGYKF